MLQKACFQYIPVQFVQQQTRGGFTLQDNNDTICYFFKQNIPTFDLIQEMNIFNLMICNLRMLLKSKM